MAGDYDAIKAVLLELSVEIGLLIDSEFSEKERRKPDSQILIDSFNSQVAKLRQIIRNEETYDFLSL